jgi:diketogulonate reductase-like aldo/keto reductase
MPRLGLGTWLLEGAPLAASVEAALEAGYRHFDTAAAYRNEAELGRALRASGLPRQSLFVTSKIWNSDQGRELTRAACLASLERLGLERLDLCLLHWPVAGRSLAAWEELERLQADGLVGAAGVSNFDEAQLGQLWEGAAVKPQVNQVEMHPFRSRAGLLDWCRARSVVVTAYSPLARGRIRKSQLIQKLARKRGRTEAQIVLRWLFQRGVALIPKSATPERVRENAAIFGFALGPEEMAALGRQNQDRSVLKPKFEFDGEGFVVDRQRGSGF